MKEFIYETHLHTCEGSACGVTCGADYIKPYKDAGYSGIFVTDHFFGGNCAVDRSLNWEQKIEAYCKGYENALAACSDDPDFKVFFGIEQTFQGDDYLIYGLDKEWLLAHPEVETMNHQELFAAVNSVGGLMIQAHPFRLRGYQAAMHLHPRDVHGVEVYNGGNKADENELAELYAQKYNFPVTSGSDMHNVQNVINREQLEMPIGGMIFDKPLESVWDYVERVKAKEGKAKRK